MLKKYPDLYSLIDQEPEADQFYNSLPDYVPEMISQRATSVNSFESLQNYADNLLQGDR